MVKSPEFRGKNPEIKKNFRDFGDFALGIFSRFPYADPNLRDFGIF